MLHPITNLILQASCVLFAYRESSVKINKTRLPCVRANMYREDIELYQYRGLSYELASDTHQCKSINIKFGKPL